MNDKTKNGAVGSLFRVNYSFVADNGQVRGGAIVLEAADVKEAWKAAEAKLATFNIKHCKVTNAKPY